MNYLTDATRDLKENTFDELYDLHKTMLSADLTNGDWLSAYTKAADRERGLIYYRIDKDEQWYITHCAMNAQDLLILCMLEAPADQHERIGSAGMFRRPKYKKNRKRS